MTHQQHELYVNPIFRKRTRLNYTGNIRIRKELCFPSTNAPLLPCL